MNNYRIISDIGSGAYSTVHKAIDVNTGHIVAIKKISDQNMNISHIINREVAFLHQCIDHPNIIQLYKCFTLGSFTYLVFEYLPMDLISFYKSVQDSRKRNLNDDEICFISYQICNALKFLHQKGIMHRDIKPENILIDPETLNIKLIDFGFAKNNNCPANTNYMVTRWYRSLQIVLNLPYDQKVDVFAAGALILELYLGNEIFRSSSNIDQFYWIVNICGYPPPTWKKAHEAMNKFNLKKEEPQPQMKQLLKSVRPLASDLITKMLKTSPQQRISMVEAFQHPYFARFKIKSVNFFSKQNHQMGKKPISKEFSVEDSFRNGSIKRNRAFSTEQQTHLHSLISFRQPYPNKTQISDEVTNHSKDLTTKSHLKTNETESHPNTGKDLHFLSPKKHFIKRFSSKEKKQYFNSGQLLPDNKNTSTNPDKKHILTSKTKTGKNRVRSLNPHGINVVSLKKLKVHRQIEKDNSFKKLQSHTKNDSQFKSQTEAIRLNPKKEKEKPMFLRVKEKINEGRINERGDERIQMKAVEDRQTIRGVEDRQTIKSQIPTKIYSSAQLKVRRAQESKQFM